MKALLALLALTPFAVASAPVQSVSLSASASRAKSGKVPVTVVIAIPAGWHIYGPKAAATGVPTKITVKGTTFKIAKITYPKTRPFTQLGETSQVYMDKVSVPLLLQATKKVTGKQRVQIIVNSQACNDRTCMPPDSQTVTVTANMG